MWAGGLCTVTIFMDKINSRCDVDSIYECMDSTDSVCDKLDDDSNVVVHSDNDNNAGVDNTDRVRNNHLEEEMQAHRNVSF